MFSEYNLEVPTYNFQLLSFNYEFQSSEVQIYSADKKKIRPVNVFAASRIVQTI